MNDVPRFRKMTRTGKLASGKLWRRMRQGAVALAFVLLVGGGYALYKSDIQFGPVMTDMIARASGATVAEISITGVQFTPHTDLSAALNLKKGDALVSFNTSTARTALEALPWIYDAAVARRLPDRIVVDVYEHSPMARVELGENDVWVVNKAGDHIVPVTTENFNYLPLLTGAGAADGAAALFALLQNTPRVLSLVDTAVRQGERRWDLVFKSGVTVQLPQENPAQALVWLLELEKARHVLTLAGGTVDLRLADRVTLRIPPEAEAGVVLDAGQKS